MASLVQAIHRDLKSQILCLNDLIRYESEFRTMRSSIDDWLDKKPNVDKLLESRQTLKGLKSKLRHKLADKHDAEEVQTLKFFFISIFTYLFSIKCFSLTSLNTACTH